MLLLLLLSLAALGPLSESATFKGSTVEDLSDCPFHYFGTVWKKAYVNIHKTYAAICFEGPYKAGKIKDCIVFYDGGLTGGVIRKRLNRKAITPKAFTSHFSHVTAKSTCYTSITLKKGSVSQVTFQLRSFDKYGILRILAASSWKSKSKVVMSKVHGFGTAKINILKGRYYSMGVAECRYAGHLIKRNQGKCIKGTIAKCDKIAEISTIQCPEGCTGKSKSVKCKLPGPIGTCTVTGSNIIDIRGNMASIQDRCTYTLMEDTGIQLLAVFQDRLRKDISFLDRVILRWQKNVIELGQGGRVQLNDKDLSLGSKPLVRDGVSLSMDESGVTAALVKSKYKTSLFFDGNTAQITLKGPSGSKLPTKLKGLCGNIKANLKAARESKLSSAGCEKRHKEAPDSLIDCALMIKRCNLLKAAPFTACSKQSNPAPFISACINTLCKYPALDGLNCQFLEAYARTCKKDTLKDWRLKANCPSPKIFCQEKTCSAHEFCTENISGGTNCVCRAVFASKYREKKSFGEPTVCKKNSASVTLVGCLLKEKGIDYSVLHLNDKTCKGQLDKKSNMVTFSFDSKNTCGTEVKAGKDEITYKNTILTTTKGKATGLITRHDQVNIDFSCFYKQPVVKTMSFTIRDSSVVRKIVSGGWKYSLAMKAYTDPGRTQAVASSTKVQLQQTIWVELKTTGLDDKMVAVVTDSCWATNKAKPTSALKYDLIVKGCSNPKDDTVKVNGNGLGLSNYFSFGMFQFSGKEGDVYLHCKLNLCVKTKNKSCAPSCGGKNVKRKNRSAEPTYEEEHSALITMAWN